MIELRWLIDKETGFQRLQYRYTIIVEEVQPRGRYEDWSEWHDVKGVIE